LAHPAIGDKPKYADLQPFFPMLVVAGSDPFYFHPRGEHGYSIYFPVAIYPPFV